MIILGEMLIFGVLINILITAVAIVRTDYINLGKRFSWPLLGRICY